MPLTVTRGQPVPDAGVTVPIPSYLQPTRSPWLSPLIRQGRHVSLEPMDPSHAAELFVALDDPSVWEHMTVARPLSVADMRAYIESALADPGRAALVQRDAGTGEIVGTTSLYAADPVNRTIAIGHTALGRKWWRTGINTETKLLLMTRAFDELGRRARGVVHGRSQRAVTGGTRAARRPARGRAAARTSAGPTAPGGTPCVFGADRRRMALGGQPFGRYAAVMLGITNPWTFLIGTVAIVLLPGPNTLFVLSVAGRFGVRAGYRAAAGVWIGDSMLMTLSAAGAASLLHAYPALFLVVKWAGAAIWRMSGSVRSSRRGAAARLRPRSRRRCARSSGARSWSAC